MSMLSIGRRARVIALGLCTGAAACSMSACASTPDDTSSVPIQPTALAADIRFIQANGLRFAYLEEGTGPLILLLHGYPETARSWSAVQHRLAAAGYRVVAPFMRGYPPSAFPADGDYAAARLGEDALALIGALGEQSATLVGHDWGGMAAYTAASMQPEKIAKLVGVAVPPPRAFGTDPTIFVAAPHFVYYQLPWAAGMVRSHDFEHVERMYKLWAPSYTAPPEVIDDIKATFRIPGAVEGALGYYRALLKNPLATLRQARAPVTVPTLMIAGKEDGAFALSRFEKASVGFTGPHALVALNGVGHFPQLEAPEQTADAILAFLRGQ